jgi:general secretion pathway protein H
VRKSFFVFLSLANRQLRLNSVGMSLIEILVVLAVVAGLITTIVPRIGVRQNVARSLFREFTAISKELHANARLQNKYYRLVIHLEPDPKKPDMYWIESGGSNSRVLSKKDQDALAEAKKSANDAKAAPTDGFVVDTAIIKKQRPLPDHFKFPQILQQGAKQPYTDGDVYIHYLPQGFVQDTLIQLTDSKNTWTMHISPLTGTLDIIDGAKTFEDFRR